MSGALAWGTDTTTARHQSSLGGTPVMSVISYSGKHHLANGAVSVQGH